MYGLCRLARRAHKLTDVTTLRQLLRREHKQAVQAFHCILHSFDASRDGAYLLDVSDVTLVLHRGLTAQPNNR